MLNFLFLSFALLINVLYNDCKEKKSPILNVSMVRTVRLRSGVFQETSTVKPNDDDEWWKNTHTSKLCHEV